MRDDTLTTEQDAKIQLQRSNWAFTVQFDTHVQLVHSLRDFQTKAPGTFPNCVITHSYLFSIKLTIFN